MEPRDILGLDIESRVKVMKALPEDVLAALKECHVIFEGPPTTPKKGDKWPNLESANVSMCCELDLFAKRPRPAEGAQRKGIDWIFYRENTVGRGGSGQQGL